MKCKKCNSNIADGELICTSCGYESALMEARERLEMVKQKQRDAVLTSAKKPLPLAVAICLSVMAICNSINCVQGNFFVAIPAVFIIIGAVGFFGAYFAKDNTALATSLVTTSIFDVYNKVVYYILAVFAAIGTLGVGALGLFFIGSDQAESLLEIIQIALIAIVIAGLGFAALCLALGLIHRRRRKYFLALSTYPNNLTYSYKKAPVIGSYIIGAICALFGAIFLMLATKSGAIISLISKGIGLISGVVGGAELIISALEALLVGIVGGFLFAGISQLVTGLFYILSAYWMSDTHTAILAARSFVNHENVRRLELERKTKEERARMQNVESTSHPTESGALPEGEATVGTSIDCSNAEASSSESTASDSTESIENNIE